MNLRVGIGRAMIGPVSKSIVTLILLCFLLSAQEPAILRVRVIEGDGASYSVGSRATRGIAVQVTDETGKPVDGVTVAFRLPEDGPSGAFSNGSKMEIATTRPDGKASAWGMRWNRTAGMLEIRITAVKGQTRAGIVCSQYLTGAPLGSSSTHAASGGSHKWLWIALGVGGAAGVALAAGVIGGKNSSISTVASTAVQIGSPTIILGHP